MGWKCHFLLKALLKYYHSQHIIKKTCFDNLWVWKQLSFSCLIVIFPPSVINKQMDPNSYAWKNINWTPQTFCKLIMSCLACHPNNAHSSGSLVLFMEPSGLWKYGVSQTDLSFSLTLPTVISIIMTHHRHPRVFIFRDREIDEMLISSLTTN